MLCSCASCPALVRNPISTSTAGMLADSSTLSGARSIGCADERHVIAKVSCSTVANAAD